MMERKEDSYEFIDDRRTDGVDKVDGKLQEEYNKEERRHCSLPLWSARIDKCGYEDKSGRH